MLCEAANVVVVMSTYNGARYVREQLESVLAQDVEGLRVLVRDDGSTDDTVSILGEYEAVGDIKLVRGRNVGVTKSFFEALSEAGPARYYSLCDQDDRWLPGKLARALDMLARVDDGRPVLYRSELNYCDEGLSFQSTSHLNRIGVNVQTMLYENICYGNTMVFNAALRDVALCGGVDGVFAHDWWLGLVASIVGRIVCDDESRVMYRRTGTNVSPSGLATIPLAAYRIRKILFGGQMRLIQRQVEEAWSRYGDEMDAESARLICRMLEAGRLSRTFAPGRFRQRFADELLLRLSFFLGLI